MRTPLTFLLLVVIACPAFADDPEKPTFLDAEIESLITNSQSTNTSTATKSTTKLLNLGPAAVPALTQRLWSDTATTRRHSAMILGMMGADARSATPSLVRLLNDDNTEVRFEATRTLFSINAHSAIPALTTALKDESAAVSLSAAQSLIYLGADAEIVLPVLTKALKSTQPKQQEIAVQLLSDLGPEAAPAVLTLQSALSEADPVLTSRIVEALGRIGSPAQNAVSVLKKKLKDDPNAALFRVQAAIALWRINRDPDAANLLRESLSVKKLPLAPHVPLWRIDPSKKTIDALVNQLKSQDEAEVFLAADILGKQAKSVVPKLIAAVQAQNPSQRLQAIFMLGRIGPDAREAIDPLTALTKQKNEAGNFEAAVALYQIAPKPENAMAIAEYLENKEQRIPAANALRLLQPNAKAIAIELLVALDNADDAFRLAAACALWRIEKNPAALKAAVKSLHSSDPKIREQAAVELGAEFGPDAKSAMPDLVKRLFDSHTSVRAVVAEALGRIGPNAKDATPALLTLLESNEPSFVQSAACEALGLIEPTDKDAVTTLLRQKLEHPAPLVRVHAALALARVASDKSGEQEAIHGLHYRAHQVRITAAEALWQMNRDAHAVPLLVLALEESNLSGQEGENERYMAVRALGRIGQNAKAAVPELLKLLDARDPDLAATARIALKAIDPDAVKKAGMK